MSIGIYYPWIARVVKRKHTRDFSKVSAGFLFAVQLNGFILATVEQAPFLQFWYISQSLLCGAQLVLIYLFWDN